MVAPAEGAGLRTLEVEGRPVLSAGAGRPPGPFALALNLLLPFSNRVSDPGRHGLAPNLPGEPFPIHGDAFQKPWAVEGSGADWALLRLADGAAGPFRYAAEVEYRLSPERLEARLGLASRAGEPRPFGLGFHPWFPRGPATRIRFAATGGWPQDDRFLPRGPAPEPLPPELRFDALRPLPEGWVNMAFDGWDGRAEIAQGNDATPVRLAAQGLGTAVLYSPSAAAPFFCFEPVSHPVDALNLPGRPGLVTLAPGEALGAAMTLDWGP